MRKAVEQLQPPQGAFDPSSAWEHTYKVYIQESERGAKGEHPKPYGTLVLNRKAAESGRFQLDVNCEIFTRARSGLRTRATLTCAADRLATPQEWRLNSEPFEQNKPVEGTSVTETATVRDGVVVRTGRVARKLAVPGPFTSNWSLCEAVQRLPFDSPTPLRFDMLEDLDLFKAGQSLHSVDTFDAQVGGRTLRLHTFRQIGHGILPYHYWLDDQRRLIAAAGGLRAILWEKG